MSTGATSPAKSPSNPGLSVACVSEKLKGAISIIPTLPARDSEMELRSAGELEPVSKYLP